MKHISYIFFLVCVGLTDDLLGMNELRKPIHIVQMTDCENYCIYTLYFDNSSRLQAGLWRVRHSDKKICHVIESYADRWRLLHMDDKQSKEIFKELQQFYEKRHCVT